MFQSRSLGRGKFSSRCTRAVFATPTFTKRSGTFRVRSREFSGMSQSAKWSRLAQGSLRAKWATALASRGRKEAAGAAKGVSGGSNTSVR